MFQSLSFKKKILINKNKYFLEIFKQNINTVLL